MIKNVTEILSEKHSIIAQPGKGKLQCPFCVKKKFSINRENTIGKCFNPDCREYITPWQGQTSFYGEINQILDEAQEIFHMELLSLKKEKGENAYSYLKGERNIHQKVIKDSFLGAVPGDFDPEKTFSKLIKKIRKELADAEKADSINSDASSKNKISRVTNNLKLLKEIKRKFINCFKNTSGWLCFFYTDENGRITAIRLRQPYATPKKVFLFKPFSQLGVFGLSLFQQNSTNTLNNQDANLLVTEGEFNPLQIQSLSLRKRKKQDKSFTYINVIAAGSATSPDLEAIKRIDPFPDICYDNDASNAGFALVTKTQKLMPVKAFTTPDVDSDPDGFISALSKTPIKAWKIFIKLRSNAEHYFRGYDG